MRSKLNEIIVKKFGQEIYETIQDELDILFEMGHEIQQFMYDFINGELTEDFFKPGHFKDNIHYKFLLNEEISTQISLLVTKLFPKERLDTFTDTLFTNVNKKEAIKKTGEELLINGYSVWPELISEQKCDQLVKELSEINFYSKKSKDKVRGYDFKSASLARDSLYRARMQDLISNKEMQSVSFNKTILQIAQNYLFSPPIHVQTNCWWVKRIESNSQRELSENAQMFHRDKEFLRFLKVFIYLSDVDESSGPHTYIPKSHKSTANKFGEGKSISDRFTDDKVTEPKQYGLPKVFTGKKGTVIFEDTYGFHKGAPVIKGHRLMMQLEYSNSLFFRYDLPFSCDSLVSSLEAQKSRVFANYTDKSRKRLLLESKLSALKRDSKQFIKRKILGSYD